MGYEQYDNRPQNSTYKTPYQHAEFMCSASHTYGNAVAFIESWLIDLFPKDYFRSININSRIAHRQIRNTPHEYNKKTKPIFAMSPRVDFDDDRFLSGTLMAEPILDMHYLQGMGALMPFFEDPKHGFEIKYQLNRDVMYADVIVIVATKMQQIDMVTYLQNKTVFNYNQNVKTCFESYLNKGLLKTVSNIVNIPIEDENGNTGKFLNYLNAHSRYPITYKLQGSRRTKEFYRYYPVTIDTLLNNLSADDGDKTGQVTTSYKITFTVRMEFYAAGFYFLFSKDKIPLVVDNDIFNNAIIIPTYTDVITNDDLFLPDGWNLFTNVSFQLEKPNDIIELDNILNTSIKAGIEYHIKNGLPLLDLVNIKVRKQGRELLQGVDYKIDWENLQVIFNDDDFNFFTYSLYFSINTIYLNDLIKSIFSLK